MNFDSLGTEFKILSVACGSLRQWPVLGSRGTVVNPAPEPAFLHPPIYRWKQKINKHTSLAMRP